MRLTVLVCALTCLLIAPHAYAEGDSATVTNCIAVFALAVSLLSVVIAVCQLGAARATYQAQTFLDMTQRMREFRDVRRMLHLVGKSPKRKLRSIEWRLTAEEDRIRDYLAFLNASAFLSDKNGFWKIRRNALPRTWIIELWGPGIMATWPGAWHYIDKWRKKEGGSRSGLFHQYEQLVREYCKSRRHKDPEAEKIWKKHFQRGSQQAKDSQAGSWLTSLRGPSRRHG